MNWIEFLIYENNGFEGDVYLSCLHLLAQQRFRRAIQSYKMLGGLCLWPESLLMCLLMFFFFYMVFFFTQG